MPILTHYATVNGNATSNGDFVVPSGKTYVIDDIVCAGPGDPLSWGGIIWDPSGANTLQLRWMAGIHIQFRQIHRIKIPGDGAKILRVVLNNGNALAQVRLGCTIFYRELEA